MTFIDERKVDHADCKGMSVVCQMKYIHQSPKILVLLVVREC